MNISNNQLIHRQYLQSQIWADIRHKALILYGPTCNRCGEYGTDIHHKTYERVGGFELMTDLEVLCRDCHEAHHKNCKRQYISCTNKAVIHRIEIYEMLTAYQKQLLKKIFNIPDTTTLQYIIESTNHSKLLTHAAQLLGYKDYYKRYDIIHQNSCGIKGIQRPKGKQILGFKSTIYRNNYKFYQKM